MSLGKGGDNKLFTVGHFAFGYIFSKFTPQTTKAKVNIPFVLTLSVILDVDILKRVRN